MPLETDDIAAFSPSSRRGGRERGDWHDMPMSGSVPDQKSVGQRVSWFELFYDLIIVAAVALVSKVFIKSPDWHTTFMVVTSLLVLFAIWMLTTLSHSLFPVDDPVRRLCVLAQMMLLSVSALSLGKDGLPTWVGFGAAGLALLTVALIFIRNARTAGSLTTVAWSVAAIASAGACLLVASGLVSSWLTAGQSAVATPILIVLALIVLLVPVTTVVISQVVASGGLDSHHLQERFGLFVIIVLGESFVGLLASLGSIGSIPSPLYFILTFVVAFSIWSIYFTGITSYGFPGTAARLSVWMLGHALLVMSIVSVAVELTDLTLQEHGQSLLAPDGNWTAMPMLGVMVAVVMLSSVLPACPRAIRWVQAATAVTLLVLTVVDLALVDSITDAFTLSGACLIPCAAAATARLARRHSA